MTMPAPKLSINREEFTSTANERFNKAREFWRNWRVEAVDDYAFVSGKQWLEEDEALLRSEKRPPITFNYSEKMVDAVVGAEVSNRQEVHYAPRGVEDAGLADLWNAAAKWVREECNAEDEETDAFRDSLICGMGWTWTRLAYDEDPDGKIIVERIDPLEMRSDPAATKPGLMDRRWQFRLYWASKKDVKRAWPDAATVIESPDPSIGVITIGNRYNDEDIDETERHKEQVQLRLYECYELEPFYRVATADGMQEFSSTEFTATMRKALDEAGTPYLRQQKRVYYRAFFSGETLLEVALSPSQKGFTFQCITAKRDRNRNTWYGLTRVMKDPQRWANKWLSQILHIINSNAKGGLLAEVGAFVDQRKAQEEWSAPNSVTLLNESALSQGKVQQKQAPPYPAGLDKLMSFALESLPMVTGINLEALGLANREQAGVLEAQRKQAAYGLLSPLFDALRRYRKEQGRVLLDYIHEYISDGRLIRIGGPDSQQFVPLTKQANATRYDIIVDQSPNAPDTKQQTWEALVEIIPSMLKAGLPLPPDLLDYTPLPTALTAKWKKFAESAQQGNEQMQQQMQQLQQENEALKKDQQAKQNELAFKQQEAAATLDIKRQQAAVEQKLARDKAAAEFNLEGFRQDRAFELERRRAVHDASMKKQQLDNDFKIKAFSTGANADEVGNFKVGLDTGDLPQLLSQVAQSGAALGAQAQQSNAAVLQAVQQLTEALSKPRKLILDQAGRPVGSSLQ